MKTSLALSLALLTVSTVSHAEISRQCWDGSFGYNYLNAKETTRGVEISLEGSTLGLPQLYDSWNHSIVIGEFNHGTRLHALLPLDSKIEDAAGNITLSTKTIGVETADGWIKEIIPTLWLEHYQSNLGQSQKLITDIPVHTLKVELKKDVVSVSFRQARAPGTPAVETVSVACRFAQAANTVVFPEELQSFLDKAPSEKRK